MSRAKSTQQPEVEFQVPTRLGRYKVLSERGGGGFGVVCKGYDRELKRNVALKIRGPNLRARYSDVQAEAQKLARLRHQAIVAVYDYGMQDDCPFIVSEWIDGVSVAERTARQAFDPLHAAAVALWVATALDAPTDRELFTATSSPRIS